MNSGIAARRHIIDAQGYEIATAQLAIDGKAEKCEVALSTRHLQLGTY
jgi:hypothetical protein